jgi:hypothetical protein
MFYPRRHHSLQLGMIPFVAGSLSAIYMPEIDMPWAKYAISWNFLSNFPR